MSESPTFFCAVVISTDLSLHKSYVISRLIRVAEGMSMIRAFGAVIGCALIGLCALSLAGQEKKIPVTGTADADLAPFDELMLKFIADNQVPGAALAVAKDGKLVYARGFGYSD